MRMRQNVLLFVIVFATAAATRAEVPSKSNDELKKDDALIEREAAAELAKVQGTWSRTTKTEDGTFKIVKEHQGTNTTVTVFDPAGNVLTAKRSEFRLEQTGKVRIFTFFNNVVTVGPQQGLIDKEPHSYIYRISGDTFYEINGMLIGDTADLVAFSWNRVKE